MTVKEKLHTLVDQLDDAQAAAALTLLDRLGVASTRTEAPLKDVPRNGPPVMSGQTFYAQSQTDLPTLAASQGVQPITNFSDLLGDFWPEDETADQFVVAVREWRRDGDHV
ncbi:MAG TPA: hypothetical protein VNL35_13300 [Chloroflexota bacterium]|nr:hypothetical protein [Chloroflexota bacterium]